MTPRVRRYAQEAAEYHGVTVEQVLGRSRKPILVRARWAIMRRLRNDGFSLPLIGLWLGRDHSTVLHGLGKAEQSTVLSTGYSPHDPQAAPVAPTPDGHE